MQIYTLKFLNGQNNRNERNDLFFPPLLLAVVVVFSPTTVAQAMSATCIIYIVVDNTEDGLMKLVGGRNVFIFYRPT